MTTIQGLLRRRDHARRAASVGRRWAARWLALGTVALSTVALSTFALSSFALAPTAIAAKPRKTKAPATIGSRDLRPGMKGHGLTVVRGQKIERFDIEIIGVLHNKLPNQDMILIRCAGLGLEHSGVVAGMSGSPVFVHDDKRGDLLVGAVAYAFPFNKDPVAGVTPIADMMPEMDRPLRKPPENQRIQSALSLPPRDPSATQREQLRAIAAAQGPREPQMVAGVDAGGLRPLAMPVSAAGFDRKVLKAFADDLEQSGLGMVDTAGGGGQIDMVSQPFEPGSAISLVLARGDMSLAGVGTVTWVRDDHFIAFGHPFQGVGQLHLPVGNAHVLWILASQMNSFKMAVPTSDIGVLDMDRQPAIAGRIGPRASWVPVDVRVRGLGIGTEKTWHVEVVDQPRFLPMIASMVVANAFSVSEPVADAASVRLKLTVELEGGRAPMVIEDRFVSLDGSAQLGEVRALTTGLTKALVWNGFERLRIKAIHAEIDVDEARDIVFLDSARLPGEKITAGKPVRLRLGFVKPNEGPKTVDVTLPALPHDLAGEKVQVWFGPAADKPPERPEPANIDDVLTAVRDYQPHNRLAVIITLPDRSWSIRGERLTDLPMSTRSALTGHGRRVRNGHDSIRTTVDLPWTINGTGQMTLEVRDDR